MKKLLLVLFLLLGLPALAGAQTCVQADINHPLSVAVTWVDNATTETGFILERKLNNGPYAAVASAIGANMKTYTDATVVRASTPNTYMYRMKAFDATQQSAYSNEACIVFAPIPALPAPSGLTVAAISSSSFRITWEDISGETGYLLEGKASRGNEAYALIVGLPADSATYDWTGRKRYTPYCVRVKAADPGAPVSAPQCATTSK